MKSLKYNLLDNQYKYLNDCTLKENGKMMNWLGNLLCKSRFTFLLQLLYQNTVFYLKMNPRIEYCLHPKTRPILLFLKLQ